MTIAHKRPAACLGKGGVAAAPLRARGGGSGSGRGVPARARKRTQRRPPNQPVEQPSQGRGQQRVLLQHAVRGRAHAELRSQKEDLERHPRCQECAGEDGHPVDQGPAPGARGGGSMVRAETQARAVQVDGKKQENKRAESDVDEGNVVHGIECDAAPGIGGANLDPASAVRGRAVASHRSDPRRRADGHKRDPGEVPREAARGAVAERKALGQKHVDADDKVRAHQHGAHALADHAGQRAEWSRPDAAQVIDQESRRPQNIGERHPADQHQDWADLPALVSGAEHVTHHATCRNDADGAENNREHAQCVHGPPPTPSPELLCARKAYRFLYIYVLVKRFTCNVYGYRSSYSYSQYMMDLRVLQYSYMYNCTAVLLAA